MKIKVYGDRGFWRVKAYKSPTEFAILTLSDWQEAMNVANRIAQTDNPLTLVNIGLLRMRGKQLDSTFTI